MAITVLQRLTICVLTCINNFGLLAGTDYDYSGYLSECTSDRHTSYVSLHQCVISNFGLHMRFNTTVSRVNFANVKVLDTQGCIEWMSKLRELTYFSVIYVDEDYSDESLANCLSGLQSPLQYADEVNQVSLVGLQSTNQEWLNKHGFNVFGGLTNKSVKKVRVTQQNLVTAKTGSYLKNVSITEYFFLSSNKVQKIETSDFSHSDFSKLRYLDLSNNQICVIHLAAFRKLKFLAVINLENNPCYVRPRIILNWINNYPDAIVYANTTACKGLKPNCSTVLKDEEYIVIDNFSGVERHVVLLNHSSCIAPMLDDKVDFDKPQDFTALITVLSCCAVFAMACLSTFVFLKQSKARCLRFDVVREDAVRFDSESQNAQKTNADRLSGTYDVIAEPAYTEVDENRLSTSYEVVEDTNNVYDKPNNEASPEAANEYEPDYTPKVT